MAHTAQNLHHLTSKKKMGAKKIIERNILFLLSFQENWSVQNALLHQLTERSVMNIFPICEGKKNFY